MGEQIMKAIFSVWDRHPDWFVKQGEHLGLTMTVSEERTQAEINLGIYPVIVIGREEDIVALRRWYIQEGRKVYICDYRECS